MTDSSSPREHDLNTGTERDERTPATPRLGGECAQLWLPSAGLFRRQSYREASKYSSIGVWVSCAHGDYIDSLQSLGQVIVSRRHRAWNRAHGERERERVIMENIVKLTYDARLTGILL